MKISIQSKQPVNIEELPHEVVERKGIGHPDTLCDAIAERASSLYSKEVYEQIGRLPHHYFDKVMLMGGAVKMGLGVGEVIEPYRVLFAGKVTRKVGDIELPVTELLEQAASEVLVDVLKDFDPKKHLVVMDELRDYQGPSKKRPRYQPEKVEDLPDIAKEGRVSNDVNLCTGYAPLTRTEQVVLLIENYLNSKDYKKEHPYTGMDIKVAGVRIGSDIKATVNVPFISKLVPTMDVYKELTNTVREDLLEKMKTEGFEDVELEFNPQDVSGIPYLSVTGSVADTGDIGVVGRGNRQNGLISPMRPVSIEAVSGKSPIDNTGKMYGVLANRVSKAIHDEIGHWNTVTIVTFRDRPIEQPANVLVSVDVELDPETEKKVEDIVKESLNKAGDLTREFVFDGVVSW